MAPPVAPATAPAVEPSKAVDPAPMPTPPPPVAAKTIVEVATEAGSFSPVVLRLRRSALSTRRSGCSTVRAASVYFAISRSTSSRISALVHGFSTSAAASPLRCAS